MHICCTSLHLPIPIKAILEKGSGLSPLEGITTPFSPGTDCVQNDSFHPRLGELGGRGFCSSNNPIPNSMVASQIQLLTFSVRSPLEDKICIEILFVVVNSQFISPSGNFLILWYETSYTN